MTGIPVLQDFPDSDTRQKEVSNPDISNSAIDSGRIDFSKPLEDQIPPNLSTRGKCGFLISEFSKLARRPTRAYRGFMTGLLDFLNSLTYSDESLSGEFEKLSIYREALDLYPSSGEIFDSLSVNFGGTDRGKLVEVVHRNAGNGTSVGVLHFVEWINTLAPDRLKTESVPRIRTDGKMTKLSGRRLITDVWSYSQFRSDPVPFVLNSLLSAPPDDPFICRQVMKIFQKCWEMFPLHDKKEVVIQSWFHNNVNVERDVLANSVTSPLVHFLRQSLGNRLLVDNPRLIENLSLMALLTDEETFAGYVTLVPAMVSMTGSFPSAIVGRQWMVTMAAAAAGDMDLVNDIAITIDILSSEYQESNASAWDQDSIAMYRNFGQFAIGMKNPIYALFECKINGGNILTSPKRGQDKAEFLKWTILALLHRFESHGEGIPDIVKLYNRLENDADKQTIGFLFIERIYQPIFEKWFETDLRIDESVVDSAISVTRCVFDGNPDSSSLQLLVSLSGSELDNLANYGKGLEIFRFMIRSGVDKNETNGIIPKKLSDEFKKSQIIDFLVSKALSDPSVATVVGETSFRLELKPEVDLAIIRKLLETCFDADIEEYLDSVDISEFRGVVLSSVRDRICIVVRVMCEDTSRMHGLVYTALSAMEVDQIISNKVQKSTEKILRDWLVDEGFDGILSSCSRLLLHPLLPGSYRDVSALRDVTQRLFKTIHEL